MNTTYIIDVEHIDTHRYNIKAATLEEAKKEALRQDKETYVPGPGKTTVLCRHFQPNFKKV